MKAPIVSICSLTFNHAPYIRQCLDGFLMQKTDFDYEIIINDDCSTDGTTEIIKEYQEKYPDMIKPIFHKENQWSKGCKAVLQTFVYPHVRGKYMAYCEGDDYWTDPFKLQKQVDWLEKHKECGLVYAKTRVWNQERQKFERRSFGIKQSTYEDLLLGGNGIPTLTTMFRTSLYEDFLRDIKRDSRWPMGDYPMWLYYTKVSSIHFIDEYFGVYRKLLYSASCRQNYESVVEYSRNAHLVKQYFVEKYNDPYKIQIEKVFNRNMFLRSFKYEKWTEALNWYEKGFDRSYKNRIRYLLVRLKFMRNIAKYLLEKEIL